MYVAAFSKTQKEASTEPEVKVENEILVYGVPTMPET